MKAIVSNQYGSPDVLKLQDVEKPTPKDNEVLIKVHAASVNAADWHLLTADIFLVRLETGLFKRKYTILGADVAGKVEAIGKDVKQFKPGDEVFGDISGCGFGAFAEYVCASEDALVSKPSNLTFEQAASVPMAAVTALQALRDRGNIRRGQKVLINGASGGLGTFAVQIAKSFGAEVTAVCSTKKVDQATSLGADHVIDYTREDFTKKGKEYDIILAANGYHPIRHYQRALSQNGIYVMAGGNMRQLMEALTLGTLLSMFGKNKLGNLLAKPNQKDLSFIGKLLVEAELVPVIDRCYPLKDVPEAMRYLGAGHAHGKVVISV